MHDQLGGEMLAKNAVDSVGMGIVSGRKKFERGARLSRRLAKKSLARPTGALSKLAFS